MNMKMAESKAETEAREGFFSIDLFEKIKKYLRTAKKDDPPVIGTTENFCEPDPPKERRRFGMIAPKREPVKREPAKVEMSMQDAMTEVQSGHADLVNKLIEDEDNE